MGPVMTDAAAPPGSDAGIFSPPDPLALQFRHRTTGGPTTTGGGNIEPPFFWTRLDHQALNDRPQAGLTVTPVGRLEAGVEPAVSLALHASRPVGVVFRPDAPATPGQGRWFIYNLALETMAPDLDFHVAIHEARRPG